MSELQRIQIAIGNKRSQLNSLYRKRDDLDKEIARAEGEISGLQDAQSIVDKVTSESHD